MRFQTAYSTPSVVKNLIILNGLFFLAEIVLPGRMGDWLIERLGLFFWESGNFQVYQLVTSMFLHANFMHLFMNMFALWMFGRTLEYEMGGKRFLLYYMVTGIGAGLLQLGVTWIEVSSLHSAVAAGTASPYELAARIGSVTIGASGAVFGVLLAQCDVDAADSADPDQSQIFRDRIRTDRTFSRRIRSPKRRCSFRACRRYAVGFLPVALLEKEGRYLLLTSN